MEAVSYLAGMLNIPMPQQKDLSPTNGLHQRVLEAAAKWFQSQLSLSSGEGARTYLENRGLLPDTCKAFSIGYAPGQGLRQHLLQQGFNEKTQIEAGLLVKEDHLYERFRHRLMFPILNRLGKTIGFGGRLLAKGEPKYLNSPETELFHKGKTLYGLHHITAQDPLVVVEGYMDVLSLYQAGIKNAVAALGTALTEDQIALLWRYCPEPILCFDGDAAGLAAAYKAAWRSLPLLTPGYSLRFCLLQDNEDPDSLIRQGQVAYMRQQFENPMTLVDVLWQKLSQQKPVSSPEEKALIHQQTEMCWRAIQNKVLQHYYRQEFEKRLYSLMREDYRKKSLPRFSTVNKPLAKQKWGEKILLATLLNHPTLIEELGEQLMAVQFQDVKYERIRQYLLAWSSVEEQKIEEVMRGVLQNEGEVVLEALLNEQNYSFAPFARSTASETEAKEGWLHVWARLFEREQLQEHLSQVRDMPDYDEKAWKQLQYLKKILNQSV